MSKSPLILPSDPSFYELPPPPGSEPSPRVEDLLSDLGRDDRETEDDDTGERKLPAVIAGSCDSHVQIFPDPERFPLANDATDLPEPHPADDYARFRDRLGLDRAILVQSSAYGFNHHALFDALERLGSERTRGVAAVGPDTSEAELRELDAAGCVAARFQMLEPWRRIDWVDTGRIAGRVHDLLNWEIDLQMDGRFLMEVEDRIRSWPGRVVVDHIGCFLGPVSDRDPGFRALLRLIDADKVWVKISGPEESDPQHPRYPHAERLARMLIRFAPERLVWGSNWPYPATFDPANKRVRPEDKHLLPLLDRWCEDESLRDRILITNTATLWRFPPVEAATAPGDSADGPGIGGR
ncbi:MAG: amidohydrolase family protein [Thalassobaculaceae bacterium]|nr:amidohydrolase family protein [Thalassobaculaceae bacterium]